MGKNKGYTLVEMIIVIAIMAVLSGLAFYTIGIIKRAKVKAAVDTFNSQLDNLWIKTKALSQSKNQTNPSDAADWANYPLCMKVERNTNSLDDIRDGSYVMYLCYDYDAGLTDPSKVKEQLAVLPDFIDIDYTPNSSTQQHTMTSDKKYNAGSSDTGNDCFIIEFNKSDGSTKYGDGKYEFYYNGSRFSTVIINKVTGNHYSK